MQALKWQSGNSFLFNQKANRAFECVEAKKAGKVKDGSAILIFQLSTYGENK